MFVRCLLSEGLDEARWCHGHVVEVEHTDQAHECVLDEDWEASGELRLNFSRCLLIVVSDRLAHRCVDCDGSETC